MIEAHWIGDYQVAHHTDGGTFRRGSPPTPLQTSYSPHLQRPPILAD
ncbi:MAG: hypothetical protein AB1345_11605 [Chloroflexota bacterium]